MVEGTGKNGEAESGARIYVHLGDHSVPFVAGMLRSNGYAAEVGETPRHDGLHEIIVPPGHAATSTLTFLCYVLGLAGGQTPHSVLETKRNRSTARLAQGS